MRGERKWLISSARSECAVAVKCTRVLNVADLFSFFLEEQWIIVYICGSKLDSCGASSRGINQLSLLASLSQN